MPDRSAAYGATLLRVALGIMYLSHAGLKIGVFGLPGTIALFEAHGFPGWTAYAVILAELGAGALLILGIHARWVALAMVPVLLGAIGVHAGNGWVFSNPNGGWEYPAFLAVASAVQWLIGNGARAVVLPRTGARTPATVG